MASEPVNVNEFQEIARQALPKMYFDFYNGGAEDEHTLRMNVESYVSRIDMSTTILGYHTSAPIMIAPTAMHKLAHPEGEVATARAAASCNTIMAMSCSSTCTVEELASSCNAVRFFQILVFKRRDVIDLLVQRAERNGFKAIILLLMLLGLVEERQTIRAQALKPLQGGCSMLLCRKDIEWLRSLTSLPILIKGVLTPEDDKLMTMFRSIKAMEVRVDGIVVFNHGARQLDYSPATITVLEEVVCAVGGKICVLFDAGVRQGTDIVKAPAFGTQAVMVGRPVIYGLAAKGEYGVRRVIEMLKDELELTMALSGCPTMNDIISSLVRTELDRRNCRL